MGNSEIEKIQVKDAVMPGPELRKSILGAKKCLAFYESVNIDDWFKSINKNYLNNTAHLSKPSLRVVSCPENLHNTDSTSGLIQLDNSAWGGIYTKLEWAKIKTSHQKEIELGLYYNDKYNYFEFDLSFTYPGEDKFVSQSLFREFYLNPDRVLVQDMDDILLVFTGELIDTNIFN